MALLPEPWLRGTLTDVSPLFAPTLHAYQQIREDLRTHTDGLTQEQVWIRPFGLAPLGFQLRHLAGSVDRLTTYLTGNPLSEAQLAELRREMDPGPALSELLDSVDAALAASEAVIRACDPFTAAERRFIGRQKLPTTVIGLIVHLAEHSLRHTGQAISAAKLARALLPDGGDSAD